MKNCSVLEWLSILCLIAGFHSLKVACTVVTGGISQSFELPLAVVLVGVLFKAERALWRIVQKAK